MRGKIFLTGVVSMALFAMMAGAQEKTGGMKFSRGKVKSIPLDWHLKAFDADSLYGASIYKAYDYLKDRTPKAKTIVAVIDGGADITHEDIKDCLWINREEIPGNGVDDDKNGYIDDVHGWNFLGWTNGEQIKGSVVEVIREYVRLREKFDGVDTTRLSRKDYAEYRYYRNEILPESESIREQNQKLYEITLKQAAALAKQRASLGDDPENIKDRKYGNNNLMDKSALHGMHVAGIVGATRNNQVGMDGVADVELMMLRVNAMGGDEQDKEVALAIRYAVDNGAKVINMSFGKRLSPHKEWVYQAMRHAEKKGVLLVHAAGNEADMVDVINVYPVKKIPGHKALKNMITVGNVSADGHPARSSNYGKVTVDLFAPGENIYSMVLDNKYKKFGGTSMASPVVAGVIALIWNYFPELSAEEVKEILLESVTSRKGVQVNKPSRDRKRDLVDFADLCVTGGIVNAFEAVRLAESVYEGTSKR